jgi:hypothetical protein
MAWIQTLVFSIRRAAVQHCFQATAAVLFDFAQFAWWRFAPVAPWLRRTFSCANTWRPSGASAGAAPGRRLYPKDDARPDLSLLSGWRTALLAVKPNALIRRHRGGFRLFWHWKSNPAGRPVWLRTFGS